MSQRSRYARLGIALAAGSLVALAAASPAVAGVGWDPGIGDSRDWADGGANGIGFLGDGGDGLGPFNEFGDGLDNISTIRGRVDRNGGLPLLSSPHRNSRLVRVAQNGEFVPIVCQTNGELVNGDSVWYLLDGGGVWSWGPARFIDIDSFDSPPWC